MKISEFLEGAAGASQQKFAGAGWVIYSKN